MRRATDTTLENHLNRIISIHALHEESDPLYGANALLPAISIHALHEESDGKSALFVKATAQFQSTLSMRRATSRQWRRGQQFHISIHALHEESDCRIQLDFAFAGDFNPRSP